MSVGNSVRKIARELNVHLRIHKFMGGFRPGLVGAVYDSSKHKQVPYSDPKSSLFSTLKSQTENFCFIVPKLDVAIKKNISEPDKVLKISFELPIKNSTDTPLDLPMYIEKEIAEPDGIIIKKEAASHLIRIRRKKMRKHKRLKYVRKNKILLQKKRQMKEAEKENNFQVSLRKILNEKDNFSAEKYVQETLEKVNWKRPVTRVKGRLAPEWVIQQYLEEKEEKRILRQRIKELSD